MKRRITSIISTILSAAILASSVPVFSADAPVTSADYSPDELACDSYDIDKYLLPFWEGNIVYNEVVYPLSGEDGSLVPLSLMYDASEIISVKSYTLQKTYTEGTDYTLEDGKLVINPRGSIKVIPYTYVHRPDNSGTSLYPHRDGTGYEYWPETAEHSLNCLAVTYIHNDEWHSVKPDNAADALPLTMDKLIHKKPLKIVTVGDSVTTGQQASAVLGISPYCDAYPAMTAKGLRRKFNNPNITLINSAVGGTISTWDPGLLDSQICRHSPDLVIMNYGMNDSSIDRIGLTDEEFETNMRTRIEYIRESNPDCEFILLSSLYGNILTFPKERYESHAAILHKIAADTEGVAAVDPQAVERPLIESGRKKFIDIMNDNMVHPNDFGMRLMAQCIVESLSLTDIRPYADITLGDLTGRANPLAHEDDGKYDELVAFLRDAREKLYSCTDEREVNDLASSLTEKLDAILIRCQPDAHKLTYTTTPATCTEDGSVTATCDICGWTEITETIPKIGGEHLWDSGRQTVSPTEKRSGILTYTCAKCGLERTETIPNLSGGEGCGEMLHVRKGLNYMEGKGKPYSSGDGTVELDICPLDVDTANDLTAYTPYVGVWFGNYNYAAAYNFKMKRFEIVSVDLPYTSTPDVYASKRYEWEIGTWHKFAVNIKNTTATIYFDGEAVLTHTSDSFRSTDNVPLVYTTGEFYLDNLRVGENGYDPATGNGSAKTWGLDDTSSQKDFNANWIYGQFTTLDFTKADEDTASDASYAAHVHRNELVSTVAPTCTLPGWDEYRCTVCGKLTRDNFTDPIGRAHDFTEPEIIREPTPDIPGQSICKCKICGETFSSAIPYAKEIPGDANGDGTVNAKDVSVLMKYFAGWSVPLCASSDFDGDGKVGMKDVSALMKYLSGYNG